MEAAGWSPNRRRRLPEGRTQPKAAGNCSRTTPTSACGASAQPLFGPGEEAELTRAVRLLWIAMHGLWTLDAGGKLFIVTNDPVQKVAHDMVGLFLAGLRGRRY